MKQRGFFPFGFLLTFSVSVVLGSLAPVQVSLAAEKSLDLRHSVWAGYLGYEIARKEQFEEVAKIGFLNRVYEENPFLSEDGIKHLLREADTTYKRQFNETSDSNFDLRKLPAFPEKAVERMIDIIRLVPGYGPLAGVALKTAIDLAQSQRNEHFKNLLPEGTSYESFETGPDERLHRGGLIGSLQDELERAARHSSDDPLFAKILGDVTQGISRGVTPLHTPAEIMLMAPDFADHANIGNLLKLAAGNQTDLALLNGWAQRQFSEMHQKIGQMGQKIGSAFKLQADYVAFSRALQLDQGKQEVAVKEAERARMEEKQYFEGARATISILSSLARLGGNAHAAQSIELIGATTLQIGNALSEYGKASAIGLGGIGEFAGSAVFTANILGAVSRLVDFLGASAQPSSDQLFMEELKRIQKQLGKLSEDVQARFNRVDQSLYFIHRDMIQAFQALQPQVLDARDGVLDIQRKLREQDIKLSAIDHRFGQLMREGFGRADRDTMATCMREKFLFEMHTLAQNASNCLVLLTIFATVHAKDRVSSEWADEQTPEALKVGLMELPQGLESKLNLISRATQVLLGDQRLQPGESKANPVDWALATEAQLDLLEKLGPYRKWVSSTDELNRVLKEGNHLAGFFSSISAERFYPSSLLSKALQNYRRTTERAQNYFTTLRQQFQGRHMNGLELFGGPEQRAASPPFPGQMNRCSNFEFIDELASLDESSRSWVPAGRPRVQAVIRTPVYIGVALPDAVKAAIKLGLGHTNVCVSGIGWVEVRDCITPNTHQIEHKCAKLAVRMDLDFNGKVYMKWTLRSREVTLSSAWWNGEHGGNAFYPQNLAITQEWEAEEKGASTPVLSPFSSIELNPTTMQEIRDGNIQTLAHLQEEFKKEVLANVRTRVPGPDGSLVPSTFERELSAAAGLLRSLVTLALPRMTQGNDYLRSLLFGPEGIMDGTLVRAKIEQSTNLQELLMGPAPLAQAQVEKLDTFLASLPAQQLEEKGAENPWIGPTLRKVQLAAQRAEIEKPEMSLNEVMFLLKWELNRITD